MPRRRHSRHPQTFTEAELAALGIGDVLSTADHVRSQRYRVRHLDVDLLGDPDRDNRPRSSLLPTDQRRPSLFPLRCPLVGMPGVQHCRFLERPADDLQ